MNAGKAAEMVALKNAARRHQEFETQLQYLQIAFDEALNQGDPEGDHLAADYEHQLRKLMEYEYDDATDALIDAAYAVAGIERIK